MVEPVVDYLRDEASPDIAKGGIEDWANIACREGNNNCNWEIWSGCRETLVELNLDEEAHCTKIPSRVTRTGIDVVGTDTPVVPKEMTPTSKISTGNEVPSEAIRKKKKKSIAFPNKKGK